MNTDALALPTDAAPEPEASRTPIVDETARALFRYRRAAIGATIAAIAVVYIASALTYGRTLRSTPTPVGFHAAAADALLDGNAALFPAPADLLALDDPYDPALNVQIRSDGAHDLALYNDNLYIAAGPTTAVVLHIPSRLLGLGNLNPNTATLLAAFGGFLASVALFVECRRRFFSTLPLWGELSVIVALGIGSPALWLVSVGRGYESAVACGYFLVATGAFLLLRGLRDPKRPAVWLLALGSAAAAAAVGARPSLIASALFVGAAGIAVVRGAAVEGRRTAVLRLAWLVGPFLAIGALVGLYNYVRFDSFVEFGTGFQLAGMNMPEYPGYRASYIAPNVIDYLFLRPRFFSSWPYVYLRENALFPINDPTHHTREPVAGAFLLWPFIGVGAIVAIARARAFRSRDRVLGALLLIGTTFGAVVVLAISLPFSSSTMRYSIDFTPAFAIVAALGWASSYVATSAGSYARRILVMSWSLAVACSVAVGVALVLTPCPGTGSC